MKITASHLKFSLYIALSLPLASCTRKSSELVQTKTSDAKQVLASHEDVENSDHQELLLLVKEHTIRAQSTLYSELRQLALAPQEILDLIEKSRPFAALDRVPVNFTFTSRWLDPDEDASIEEKTLVELEFPISSTKSLQARRQDGQWQVEVEEFAVSKELRSYFGSVSSSLWESASQAGMNPSLIAQLTEIFAWQVDFGREVRPGDQWRLVVEERFVRDQSIGWGPILAAEYVNQGETYTAIRFPADGDRASYYSPDGQSLRRMFLRSPIEFARVTSRFTQQRFHPILKENRPHLGVDYAAPTGTPIRAVGQGRIVYLGYNGGSGNMIRIRHNSTYETAYLHMNGFARGLRRGSTVEQGQVIGYVGQTGLATGPHLHFSFYENGRYVDPLGRRFPSADPVPEKKMEKFSNTVAEVMPLLPDWRIAMQQENKRTGH